jgi:molybdate transport system substrate-binding protein
MNRTSILLLLALLLPACTSKNEPPKEPTEKAEILVSVAASLKESMEELGGMFEKQTGTTVLFNFAGSNELARQIVATPKVDIFLSAAENWMDTVEKAGRLVSDTRRDILSNALVVIAGSGAAFKVTTPCDLAALQFKNLALGDPESVPAGKYAKKWLSGITCGGDTLWTKLKDRVAPAPDVRAALGQVVADPDMIGIVYRTDQLQFAEKTQVLFEVKDGPPIRYVLAQVAEGSAPDAARKFLEYLSGAEAQGVFRKHGFTTLPIAASRP